MKKKVLVVINHLTIGGCQKSLITFLDSLDYSLYDVTLYLRKNRTDLLDYVNKNVSVIINDDKKKYYRFPFAVVIQFLIKLLSLFNIHLSALTNCLQKFVSHKMMNNEYKSHFKGKVFDTAISFSHGYSAYFVSKFILAKNKIVRYCESKDEFHELHQMVFDDVNSIVCVDAGVEEMLSTSYQGINHKLFTIKNIVNYNYIIKQSNEHTICSNKDLVLCSCGRFSYIKGFDIAIEAARILYDAGISFQWYFIGDGPEKKHLKTLTEQYDLSEYIVFTGMILNPYPYIKASTIIVQPSREEAMSNVLLESQVLNKPVVTTKTVGGMNIVKDGITGIQTDINAEALAEGIIRAMDKNLLASMSEELSKIDYNTEKDRYKSQWAEILS